MTYLTPGMKTALDQLANGVKFVDVRSGAALHRRGLARYEPDRFGGHYASAYHITDKGRARVAKDLGRRQVCRWITSEHKHLDQDVIDTVMEYAAWRNGL